MPVCSPRPMLLLGILVVQASWCPPVLAKCPLKPPGPFRVYQALLYDGMPDLRRHGIAPIHVVDRDFWNGDASSHVPDPRKIRAVAAALPNDGAPIVLDIETLDLHRNNPAMASNVRLLASIAASFKAAAPHRAIGYYGLFPLADYWRAIDVAKGGVVDWQRDNDAAAVIGRTIDVTFPSLYTHYRDQAGWVRQARAMVCEARRISGKPVYAFIWPEFHDSSRDAGKDVPGDFWRLQLSTLHDIADGIVIWGGYDLQRNRSRPWDENAGWWRVTMNEMRRWERRP